MAAGEVQEAVVSQQQKKWQVHPLPVDPPPHRALLLLLLRPVAAVVATNLLDHRRGHHLHRMQKVHLHLIELNGNHLILSKQQHNLLNQSLQHEATPSPKRRHIFVSYSPKRCLPRTNHLADKILLIAMLLTNNHPSNHTTIFHNRFPPPRDQPTTFNHVPSRDSPHNLLVCLLPRVDCQLLITSIHNYIMHVTLITTNARYKPPIYEPIYALYPALDHYRQITPAIYSRTHVPPHFVNECVCISSPPFPSFY